MHLRPRIAHALIAPLFMVLIPACSTEQAPVVLHRSACETCHSPLNAEAQPHGIEDAHPWLALSCTDCHGGKAFVCKPASGGDPQAALIVDGEPVCDGEWIYSQDESHPSPGSGPAYLRNLSADQLDNVNLDYLRFVNPGDFRVAEVSCGGSDCHQAATENVKFSTMAHTSGEVTVARYRAGKQATPRGEVGAVALFDESVPADEACAVESLERFEPPPIDVYSIEEATRPSVANAQDQYFVKSCFRCHLNDFGANAYPGDFRSSGCTACHMTYNDDGLSESADPRVNKQTVPHPVKHELTKSPPNQQCTHCHYRGGRIGINYQGYRESAGRNRDTEESLNPDNPGTLGETLHNHPATWYLTDENIENDCDETPPDVHFEAGMHCVDCHKTIDVHGNGNLYADTQCAVTAECTDCHGTVREHAKVDPDRSNIFSEEGKLWLRTKIGGDVLEVVQTKDVIDPNHPRYSPLADLGMGINAAGYSHTDDMECYTCHAAWIPTCYGCHVKVDLTKEQRYQTTGALVAGRSSGSREWVTLNDLVLMRNTDGKIAPSMPAERFFLSLFVVDEEESEKQQQTVSKALYENKPRTFVREDGTSMAGFGQRAFNPHTTRKRSQFMACDRCHTVGDPSAPDNEVLLDLTHGFGTQRFIRPGCDVSNEDESCGPDDQMTYRLDQILTKTGQSLVVVGHPDPIESRPLTLEEIQAMRDVIINPGDSPFNTDIPAGATSNWRWPVNSMCP